MGCVVVGMLGALLATAPAAPTPRTQSVAFARYRAGAFHQYLFGHGYRDLWTTPITVPVLDLAAFGGGLTPIEKAGRHQSVSLILRDAAGRHYKFRSTDKDTENILPDELRASGLVRLLQDQTSAQWPAAVLAVDVLATAAGVAHVQSRLFVLPDTDALGAFRRPFGGMLGTLEDKLDEKDPSATPGFEDVSEMLESKKLFKRLMAGGSERVDTRAYLRARLLDVLVGDWDRHPKNWEWVRRGQGPWEPVAEDRDQAFCRYEGLVVGVGLHTASLPLTHFGPRYGDVVSLVWTGLDMDRLLLAGVPWSVWQEEARALRERLTDDVIAAAVRRLPAEHVQLRGASLTAALASRRDHLADAARVFYRVLAAQARVVASDAAERADIVRTPESLTVRVAAQPDGATEVERTFDAHETQEVRLFMLGGDDEVVVTGRGAIKLRVVGGAGRDALDDRAGGGTHFYDSGAHTDVRRGRGTAVDTRRYDDVLLPTEDQPRDWGGSWGVPPWADIKGDTGVLIGLGLRHESYGFRKTPYASYQRVRAAYMFGAHRFRGDYFGDFRRSASGTHFELLASASGEEVLRYFGLGNETARARDDEDDDDFHKAEQEDYRLVPRLRIPLTSTLGLSVGPALRYNNTPPRADRFIANVQPYGVGRFGEIAFRGDLEWSRSNHKPVLPRGAFAAVGGSVTPALWSVERTFGEVHGEAGGNLGVLGTTLGVRVGGARVFGRYPFFEAAFIGSLKDDTTVRGLSAYRYAGDSRAFANVEWRVRLVRLSLIAPVDFGALALADVGRVFLEAEPSSQWHHAEGGGIWARPVHVDTIVSLTAARSEGDTRLQLRWGFLF
jgi:hypothetical protein